MKKSPLAFLFILVIALPSCGDDPAGTPTAPPAAGPAVLTVQVAVGQATNSASFGPTGPAKQQRKINTTVTVSNEAGAAQATVQSLRIFGAILAGGTVLNVNEVFVPTSSNTIPGGASATFSQELAATIDASSTMQSPFDVFAEVSFTDAQGNSGTTPAVSTSVDAARTLPPPGGCVADNDTGCFDIGGNDRFKVEVDWRNSPTGPTQLAQIGQGFNDGAFFFFTDQNDDLLVQLLDRCSFDDHFWVFFQSQTTVEFTVTIEDTQSHVIRSWRNPLGESFQPITDTSAFATCPGPVPIP